jgi:hypothetical protein
MKERKRNMVTLLAGLLLCLATTAESQAPSGRAAEPIGVVIANNNQVTVNGTEIKAGTTVFSGNEIQTGDGTAFVNVTSGGALSLSPGSKIKLSREQARIVAEVLQGSITVRSLLASTVKAPGRVINSEPDNLYTVSLTGQETQVRSLLKPVSVTTADGVVQTIAATVGGSVAAAAFSSGRPGRVIVDRGLQPSPPGYPPSVTPYAGCAVITLCARTGPNTVRISGIVMCNGTPVAGTGVLIRLYFQNNTSSGPKPTGTLSDGPRAGHYELTITDPNVVHGGMAVVTVQDCGLCTGRDAQTNRCFF